MSTTTFLVTNKYFFLLLFASILYIIINHLMKFPYVKKNQNDVDYLIALDKFIIKNTYYEIFVFCIYILSYFGLFLMFRIKFLGNEFSVKELYCDSFDVKGLLNIFLYILCIIYYIKIINTLFYPTIIKLHYYFYRYQWYEKSIDFIHMKLFVATNLFGLIREKVKKCLLSKEDLQYILDEEIKLNRDINFILKSQNEIEKDISDFIRIWTKINDNKLLWHFMKTTDIILGLVLNLSRAAKYFPYMIVIIVLLCELYIGIIYYFYYTLLVYFIMIWFQKIRYFFSVKDPIEYFLMEYLYKNDVDYNIIKQMLDNEILMQKINQGNISDSTKWMLNYKEQFLSYILNNFVVYHVKYPKRIANNKYLNNETKRSLIIWFLFAGVIYFYYNVQKYMINVFGINVNIWFTFLIAVILLFIIEKQIIYKTEIKSEEISPVFGEKKLYKSLFITVFLFTAGSMLFIIFKNKLTIEPNEVLLEIKDYIKIVEYFTIEQKIKYMTDYLVFIQKKLNLVNDHWIYVLKELKTKVNIDNNVTMEEIRNSLDNIISSWNTKTKPNQDWLLKYFTKIYTKIKQWFI